MADFEDFHNGITDGPSDALWAKSIENWSMWPLLVHCHFLDAYSHLYKRVCPSVCWSVCWLVCVCLMVMRFFKMVRK